VCETWKLYTVKHNYVTWLNGQLHVSARTGHLQVVLRELPYVLRAHTCAPKHVVVHLAIKYTYVTQLCLTIYNFQVQLGS